MVRSRSVLLVSDDRSDAKEHLAGALHGFTVCRPASSRQMVQVFPGWFTSQVTCCHAKHDVPLVSRAKRLLVGCCPQSLSCQVLEKRLTANPPKSSIDHLRMVFHWQSQWHPEKTWLELVRRGLRCGQRSAGVRCDCHDGLRNSCITKASLARQHTTQTIFAMVPAAGADS
jgi:hypothetical protein